MPIEQRGQEVTDVDRTPPKAITGIILKQVSGNPDFTQRIDAMRELVDWVKAGKTQSAIITRVTHAQRVLADAATQGAGTTPGLGEFRRAIAAFDTVFDNIKRQNTGEPERAEDEGLTARDKELLVSTSSSPSGSQAGDAQGEGSPAADTSVPGGSTAAPPPATSSGSGGTPPVTPPAAADGPPGPDASDEELEVYIRERYGYMAWALDHETLGPLLRNAITEQWSAQELEANIRASSWWQENEASVRNFERLLGEDPASVEADIQTQILDIKLLAARYGVTLSDERMRSMATDALKFSWNERELRSALLSEATYNPEVGASSGSIGARVDDFGAQAQQWFVELGEEQLHEWAVKVESGEATEQDFKNYVKEQATSRFPQLKQYFDIGVSPQTFFEPYKNTIASMLEMPAAQVDLLHDPRFARVLDFDTAENGLGRPMRLYELQDYVRSLPEWQNTDTAKTQAADLSQQLLTTFGAI